MRIDLKVPCKIYPNVFQAGTLKKVVCHTYKSEKNHASTLKKSGYILQGIFYRVYFTGYPSNHFSGCRLNGRIIYFAIGRHCELAWLRLWSINLMYSKASRYEASRCADLGDKPGPCIMQIYLVQYSSSARSGKSPQIFTQCKFFQLVRIYYSLSAKIRT